MQTGEFLLGYLNESGGTYTVQPAELSTNSSYAAFRILEQDVAGFEAFLVEYAAKAGIDAETAGGEGLRALAQRQSAGAACPTLRSRRCRYSELNDFTYVSTDPAQDDTLGLKCPIGSHIRRNNPRNGSVVGTDSTHHRIVRRAMPYGPPYDPEHPRSHPGGPRAHRLLHQREPHQPVRVPDPASGTSLQRS